MSSLLSFARFAACWMAILSNGYIAAPAPPPALEQENKALDQKPAESSSAIRKSAEEGDAAAQDHLGHMYERGQGAPQDYSEAVRWYRKAADQRYADAQ